MHLRTVNHHSDCEHQTRISMSQYGASAPTLLLPNRNSSHGEQRQSSSDFIKIRVRITRQTIRLGGTQRLSTEEQFDRDQSKDCYSVRQGNSLLYTHRPSLTNQENSSVSLQGPWAPEDVANQPCSATCEQNNERSGIENHFLRNEGASYTGGTNCQASQRNDQTSPVEPSQGHRISQKGPRRAPRPGDRERSIKEDVNCEQTQAEDLERKNDEMRSRLTCRRCRIRPCNIVLRPCGHMVVCNMCIQNTTECPKCGEKVDEAIRSTF